MNAQQLLEADATSGRVALAARTALLCAAPPLDCPRYWFALSTALNEEPPPFDTEEYAAIYADASKDARWLAVSLITNAEREGDGAKRLWSLAACSDNEEERALLKAHALDESRHALYYLAILDLTFPTIVSDSFRAELNKLSPQFSASHDPVPIEGSPYAKKPCLDDFLQMNIAEIRTTIHHIMQRPAIAQHCSAPIGRRVLAIQEVLLRDELRHVAYTAKLIEHRASTASAESVSNLFTQRFRDFNQITRDELGATVFDCSVACCARHATCRPRATPYVSLNAGPSN